MLHRINFIIQIIFLGFYIIFKTFEWPGVAAIAILSWTFTILLYLSLTLTSLFKKELDKSALYFTFILSVGFIPTKLLFTYYNVILHFIIFIVFIFILSRQQNEINKNFKKLSYIVIALNFLLIVFDSKTVNENVFSNYWTRPYSCGPVNWSHFNKVDSIQEEHEASIDTYILYKANKAYNYKPAIVMAVMDRSGSFYTAMHDDLLNHENYHFKLTEVYSRKINNELNKYHFANADKTKSLIRVYLDSLEIIQKNYDVESNHGLNIDNQKKWQKYIDNQLLLE